jgi:dihydrofolate reductase
MGEAGAVDETGKPTASVQRLGMTHKIARRAGGLRVMVPRSMVRSPKLLVTGTRWRRDMRRLVVLGWAKSHTDAEFNAFVADNAKSGGMLLLGRITYELMSSYSPTPQAKENDPVVAERMNDLPKVVFSKTLEKASWSNTKLVKGDLPAEIRKMKREPGKDMTILGSGSLVSQLAREGLIDEYQMVVNPVVLGEGRTMFDGIKEKLTLKLTNTRTFGNGNVFLRYEPMA